MSFLSGFAGGLASGMGGGHGFFGGSTPTSIIPQIPSMGGPVAPPAGGGFLSGLGADLHGIGSGIKNFFEGGPSAGLTPNAQSAGMTPGGNTPFSGVQSLQPQAMPTSVVSPLGNPIAPSSVPGVQDPMEKQFPLATKVATALGTIESSNNYNALGPQVNGQHAVGRYQIMPENIPQWSAQAGQPATVQQFQSNHELQDRVAIYHINTLLNEGYSPQDVASMWLSGRPLAHNNAQDKATGISVPAYVQKFNNVFNRPSMGATA